MRGYELYICPNRLKNAASQLIRPPDSPPPPKRKDKTLFEASFVKFAVVDFFSSPSPPHLFFSPFCMKGCLI